MKYQCSLCHAKTSKDRYDKDKKCIRCGGHLEKIKGGD